MPRLSRPTLKPNASSACLTAFSSERDWARRALGTTATAAAAIAYLKRGRESIDGPAPIETRASLGHTAHARSNRATNPLSARWARASIDLRTVSGHKRTGAQLVCHEALRS